MMRALLPALALLLVPTAAYAADDFDPETTDDAAQVKAWETWDGKDIDDYVTSVKLSCFCPEMAAVRTVVRDGEVRKVRQGGKVLAPSEGYSMDRLFLMIRDGYETADRVEVDYTGRGVPKSITIDESKMIADEERYYTVSLVRR